MVITIVGAMVLSLGAVFMIKSFGTENAAGEGPLASTDCETPVTVSLSTTPELKPQLESAAKALTSRDDSRTPCTSFNIDAAHPAAVAQAVAAGDEQIPDLWVPDSSLWVSRADDGQSLPIVAVPSLATSPLVVVGSSSTFADTSSWLGIFSKAPPALLDPLSTSTGAAALLAVKSEVAKTSSSEDQVAQVLVPLAQRHGSMAKAYTDLNGLFTRAAQSDNLVVPSSEQAFVNFQEAHPDSGLKAIVPGTGTLTLDYPLVVTAKDDVERVTETAKLLGQQLRSAGAVEGNDKAGFRGSTLEPLTGGRGVGAVELLGKPQPQVVEKTLQQWATLALSAHSIAVIDTSGSMNEKVGNGKRRIDLTIAAAEKGLALFPNSAALGLWSFSTKQPPAKPLDWQPLVPIRKLTQAQRIQMVTELRKLGTKAEGGTGLYDTAIAAYRTVQDSFDPKAVNAVMIFTDGKNDDPGSISLDEAVKTLQSLRDPARPVRIIALGMGPDADQSELDKLARATGGRSYVARNPADLEAVFIDALQNR
ncbi:VWA domain-containing protein [Kribbella deserti]|uniref:VWA domain-containing protein n=1 Tax=Kribbella deserti TaxID=1926257 RepID=A0ABV6QEP7_9ACTN